MLSKHAAVRQAMRSVFVLVFVAGMLAELQADGAISPSNGIFNVADFGAAGDGETDDTGAFQMALDAAAEAGGGLVQAPTGRFLIKTHLDIPDNVTLEGVWRSPQRGEPVDAGTVLLAVEGKGHPEGPSFIGMNTQSTLRGITIYYPEQIKANPPHAYPWTVASRKFCDNAAIINVTIINPYQAVDFGTLPAGRHFIDGLYAHALHKGLYIDQCYDVGRIQNVHFWPFWDVDPNSPLWEFTRTQGTAFIIGRTDGQMGSNLFSIFYKTGMHFIRGNIRNGEGKIERTSPGSGVYTNCYMDITPCAVRVDDVMANAGVSFVNGMFMSTVVVGPQNKGQVKFTGCGFWAVKGLDSHAKLEGRGTVFFESCHFSNWDQSKAGVACIDANSRNVIVTGCEFSTERHDHVKVRLGPNVQSAVISSNIMDGGVQIENNAPESADVQIGLNAGGLRHTRNAQWVVLGPFPNPEATESVGGTPSRTGYDRDYLGPLGGEEKAVLTPQTNVPVDGKSVTAQTVETGPGNRVPFKQLFPGGNAVAYAFAYLQSDKGQTARFELGANDCSKVWVNGQLAFSHWAEEGDSGEPGSHVFMADLQEGLNSVLVKIEDAGGSKWHFVLEVFKENGNPLTPSLP